MIEKSLDLYFSAAQIFSRYGLVILGAIPERDFITQTSIFVSGTRHFTSSGFGV